MYSVSNAYLTAMKQNTFTRTLRGKIGNIDYTVDDVLTGSCTITNKISDGTEVRIGSVNIGELTITFINDHGITEWSNAAITVEEGLLLANNTYEYVPMGTYYVSKADRTASGIVITAYDAMSKFDKRWQMNATSGTAASYLGYICSSCGVTLGMTQAQIEALPNGNRLLGLYTDNDIETFRDALSWVAQTLASYATIDRQGRLVLRAYKSMPDDVVNAYERYSGETFSTFTTRYSGISVVDIKSQTTKYIGMEPDVYLTYNLGSNPFLQYGTDSSRIGMMTNILTSMQNINYTPFSAVLPCGGAYDLGDVITFSGGIGDVTGCVTSFTWNFNGTDNYIVKGEGKDPSLTSARSKTDKNLSGLMSQINAEEIQYYIFRNLDEINIGDTQEKEIINIRFASMLAATVILDAEILLDVEGDNAVGVVTYRIDSSEVTDYKPTETWIDGKHVLHLMYIINTEMTQVYHLTATLKMAGGSAYIAPLHVQAAIHGQGLVSTDNWDGGIDFEETLTDSTFGTMIAEDNMTSEVTTSFDIPYSVAFEESLTDSVIGSIVADDNMDDMIFVDKLSMSSRTHAQLNSYTYAQLNNLFING